MLRFGKEIKDPANEGTTYAVNSTPQFKHAKTYIDPFLEEMFPKIEEIRILDVGCGVGELAAYLAKKGATVVGIDVSKEMIDKANEKYGNVKNLSFYMQDAASFSLETQFDLIVSTSALQWVQDNFIKRTMEQVHKHLKPEGQFFILVPTYDFPHLVIKDVVAASDCWKNDFADYLEPQNLSRDYPTLLRDSGFKQIVATYKDTEHTMPLMGFLGFTSQWCGCYLKITDPKKSEKFKLDILSALLEQCLIKNDILEFIQTSLIITSRKTVSLQKAIEMSSTTNDVTATSSDKTQAKLMAQFSSVARAENQVDKNADLIPENSNVLKK